jgi:hypothetical protein
MKPYLRIFVALSFCISQTALGADAIATGAGAPTTDGMTATTTDSATGATTSKVFGAGAIPGGLEEAAASIKASVAIIASLPAQAKLGGADFTISGLPVMQSSAAEYESTRLACYGAQATASTMCMESTNPNIISTVAAVNLGVAGLNSLAVNDSCKGMSKIMTLAQAGMTGFLAVCGAMRLKCNMACGTTSAALSKLSGASSSGTYCAPLPLDLGINGSATCLRVQGTYATEIAKIKAALTQEANAADVTVRPVAAKVAICSKGYALMLASGAVSLMSIVNSMKQSKKCDDDSDGGGSSSTASTAAASTTTAAASTTGAGTTTAATSTTETPETSSNLIVAPDVPAANATADTTANSQVRTAAAKQAAESSGARGSLSASGSSLSTSGASADLATGAVSEKTSQYQAYMPGGSKDPSRNIAGQSAYEKEVTAAGGKSNWSKTRDAYRNLKTLEDE